jgi:hypothetical protein
MESKNDTKPTTTKTKNNKKKIPWLGEKIRSDDQTIVRDRNFQ